jgi:hypothetical protein
MPQPPLLTQEGTPARIRYRNYEKQYLVDRPVRSRKEPGGEFLHLRMDFLCKAQGGAIPIEYVTAIFNARPSLN